MRKALVVRHRFCVTIGCDIMGKPLISVIIPVYNGEKWIESCCKSVFCQDYPNWELIVVDDGSSDNTLELVQNLAKFRKNFVVLHQENGGVCCARNRGMDYAQGELLSFLDADDMLLPNALSVLYEMMERTNSHMAVGCKTIVKPDGTEVPCHLPEKEAFWQGDEGLIQSLKDHPATYSVWGKLYRRELMADVRFIEGKKVHEDSYFIFQCMLKQPRVAVADVGVLLYRETENSASRGAFSEKLFDILYFAEEKYRIVQQQYPQYVGEAKNMLLKAHMALLRNLCKTNDRHYRQVEKESLKAFSAYQGYYVPASEHDQRWFWILKYHLYGAYKMYYRIRFDI